MDAFTYLSVPISIILGLAITELLLRVARIIQCRARTRFYWPPLIWVLLALITAVQSWWALFGLKAFEGWNFFNFLIVLVHPIAFFLMTSFILPDREEFSLGEVDLERHYFAHFRWFYAALILTITASLLRPIVLFGRFSLNLDVGIQAFLFVVAGVALCVRAKWFHQLATVTFLATIAAYIGLLYINL